MSTRDLSYPIHALDLPSLRAEIASVADTLSRADGIDWSAVSASLEACAKAARAYEARAAKVARIRANTRT